MADSVGVDSRPDNPATRALHLSNTLNEIAKNLGAQNPRVNNFQDELEDLCGVLGELTDKVDETGFDLAELDCPLMQCGSACKDFGQELMTCLSRSGSGPLRLQDLRYMGDNIVSFTELLAMYKHTIIIVLEEAVLHIPTLTAETLENHKVLAATATTDLEDRIASLDRKLQDMNGMPVLRSSPESNYLHLVQAERRSALKCLEICTRFSEHLSQIQLPSEQSHDDDEFEREVSKAKTYRRGNVSIVDNYAVGDAVQFMTSIYRDRAVYGRNRGLGRRTRQFGGYYDAATLQKISGDYAIWPSVRSGVGRSAQGKVPAGLDREEAESSTEARGGRYKGRYVQPQTDVVEKPAKFKGSSGGKPSGSLKK